MNFTREPIIETVITPREGCKLVVRSSKGVGQEDYFVDAVEVVSFGHSFFFRSQERPKSFLVPVSDYEILELKETRMVLKNIGTDRSIKIGGGRDMSVRAPREHQPSEEAPAEPALEDGEQPSPMTAHPERLDKKQGRRRSRRRRGGGGGREGGREGGANMEPRQDAQQSSSDAEQELEPEMEHAGGERNEEIAPSFISKLFPPPPTLIKETLSRYKTSDEGIIVEEKSTLPEELFEHPTPEPQLSDTDDETKLED